MNGVELIAAERLRQVEVKGYTAQEDDGWDGGEITHAAAEILLRVDGNRTADLLDVWGILKKTERRYPDPEQQDLRLLVVAGALVAAEIDRRLREAEAKQSIDERIEADGHHNAWERGGDDG